MNKLITPEIIRRLQQLRILKRKSFLGMRAGGHVSLRRGAGLEFSDYSVYVPGDDFRRIDWSVFGRTERLYVRRFHEEQDLNVSILIDGSASMRFNEKKQEKAEAIALALSLIALASGDTVVMSILGNNKRIKVSGLKGFRGLVSELDKEIEIESEKNFSHEVQKAVAIEKHPGRCFLISDLLFETELFYNALFTLQKQNYEVSVIQVLSPEEYNFNEGGALMLRDSESGEEFQGVFDESSIKEYSVKLEQHLSEIQAICKKFLASYLLVKADTELSEILIRDFSRAGFVG